MLPLLMMLREHGYDFDDNSMSVIIRPIQFRCHLFVCFRIDNVAVRRRALESISNYFQQQQQKQHSASLSHDKRATGDVGVGPCPRDTDQCLSKSDIFVVVSRYSEIPPQKINQKNFQF